MKTFFLLTLLSFSLNAQTLKPGFWKAQVTFKVNGIPLPTSNEEDCILPDEVKDVKASIMKNMKRNKCDLTKWEVKGKHLEAAVICKNDDLDATGTIRGTVLSDKYNLDGQVSGTYKQMLPATAVIKIQGQWIKACEKTK